MFAVRYSNVSLYFSNPKLCAIWVPTSFSELLTLWRKSPAQVAASVVARHELRRCALPERPVRARVICTSFATFDVCRAFAAWCSLYFATLDFADWSAALNALLRCLGRVSISYHDVFDPTPIGGEGDLALHKLIHCLFA